MDISNAKLAFTLKQVAKTVAPIVKQKNLLKEKMETLEAKYREKLEAQLAKYKAEYEELDNQQELFEKPIREVTGGYGTEDLVVTELVESGTSKDGKPIRKTRFVLRYPETIIPSDENTIIIAGGVDPVVIDIPCDEEEEATEPLVPTAESFAGDLPFSM